MKKLVTGILAHVDAGKTTLSEAMLFACGSIRKLGRVDKGDTYLDTSPLEKKRGITIFSKQARLAWGDMDMTFLDTPGHVDFSAEMERTLQVLDYAVLVISGTDGVQGHTRTLWRLLSRYNIPTFLFVNKMDLAGERKQNILDELRDGLKGAFVDFDGEDTEAFYENIALCGDEKVLDVFLDTGRVEKASIQKMIRERTVFPCFFGSALKEEGVKDFLNGMDTYSCPREYSSQFGARVFKITRDSQGNRLTHMKITGGILRVRDILEEEKVNQIRIYSGEKYEAVNEAGAGDVCAVMGLTKSCPGQVFGCEQASVLPVLEPVLTCRIELPEDIDAAAMLPKLIQLEEEEPELHIAWEESKKELHAQIMGEIQTEVLKSLILERFDVNVEFGGRSIVYKETIADTVEGVGHFEPLRHYSEVHLLLEPCEPGSGLLISTACSEDILDRNWQRQILSHLEAKEHKGVLTGAALTDVRITLMSGRAHRKHTEGGDFRQAALRAVRQGLMQAKSVLLEPFYDFRLEVPEKLLGRAMYDVERMNGRFEAPLIEEGKGILTGSAPVACLDGYQKEVTAYTGGTGSLICTLRGYGPCHNEDEIVAAANYEPVSDLENTPDSVFCAHGAGFAVSWDEVKEYMHLESCLLPKRKMNGGQIPDGQIDSEGENRGRKKLGMSGAGTGVGSGQSRPWLGTEEVDAILERTFYANRNGKSSPVKKRWGVRPVNEKPTYTSPTGGTDGSALSAAPRPPAVRNFQRSEAKESYLLVDGYNIVYSWPELKELAAHNIDSARGRLLDILCNYQGMKKCNLIAVFDAYQVQGHPTEYLDYHNIHVVYTKEAETADQYIEKFAHENGKKYSVTVATSDYLEQIIIRGQGCQLLSAREFLEDVNRRGEMLFEDYEGKRLKESSGKNYLFDSVSDKEVQEIRRQLKDNE